MKRTLRILAWALALVLVLASAVPASAQQGSDDEEGAAGAGSSFDLASDNTSSASAWSDGTTLWVLDGRGNRVYAYSLSDGTRDTGREFELSTDRRYDGWAQGMWSDGTTMWVEANWKLYAYALSDGARDADNDIALARPDGASAESPQGMWSDGTTVWMLDSFLDSAKAYAYALSDGARDADSDISLYNNPERTFSWYSDMWSNGTAAWVAESIESVVHAYSLSDGSRVADMDVRLGDLGTGETVGIWSDGDSMWVVEDRPGADRVHVLDLPEMPKMKVLSGFSLVDASSQQVVASLADGAAIELDDPDGGSYAIRADLIEGESAGSVSLELSGAKAVAARTDNQAPFSLYGESESGGVRKLNGESLPTGHYTLRATPYVGADLGGIEMESLEISFSVTYTGFLLAVNNARPWGAWSDGATLWVVDEAAERVFAYSLPAGTRDRSKEFDLPHGAPVGIWQYPALGIWSDGTTAWSTKSRTSQLYAYTLSDGTRDPDKDLAVPGTREPGGLWSDGTTIWVVDTGIGETARAYSLSDGTRDEDKDISLYSDHILAVFIDMWADDTTAWVSDTTSGKIYAYNTADGSRNAELDITGSDYGIEEPGGLWSDGTNLWVVEDRHGVRSRVKALSLPQRDPSPSVASPADGPPPPAEEDVSVPIVVPSDQGETAEGGEALIGGL